MSGALLLPGQFWRESEFVQVPAGQPNAGRWLTGSCGPNALAMATSWAKQQYTSTLAVYQVMLARGWCDANGVSNINQLYDAAGVLGLAVPAWRQYGEPWNGWEAWVQAHLAAGCTVILEPSYGQALVDSLSGLGMNATNLHYHFNQCVGYHPGGYSRRAQRQLPAGWWMCDGDNRATGNTLQFYPESVMAHAAPCAAIAIGPIAAAARAAVITSDATDATEETSAMTYAPDPNHAGWYKDSGSGLSVGGGIYAAANQAGLTAQPLLLGETPLPGENAGSIACFGAQNGDNDGVVVWYNGATFVSEGGLAGHAIVSLVHALGSLSGQLENAQSAAHDAQVAEAAAKSAQADAEAKAAAAAEKAAQDAQAEVEALKAAQAAAAQPTPAPVSAPNPAAEAALAAVQSLKSAFAQIEAVAAVPAASPATTEAAANDTKEPTPATVPAATSTSSAS